jgi:hypothetical protein
LPDDAQQNTRQPDSPQESFLFRPPKIDLPIGGGVISGIREKFAANPVMGAGSISVPIATCLGRSGFGPQFSLSYDSVACNGIFYPAGVSAKQIEYSFSFGCPVHGSEHSNYIRSVFIKPIMRPKN